MNKKNHRTEVMTSTPSTGRVTQIGALLSTSPNLNLSQIKESTFQRSPCISDQFGSDYSAQSTASHGPSPQTLINQQAILYPAHIITMIFNSSYIQARDSTINLTAASPPYHISFPVNSSYVGLETQPPVFFSMHPAFSANLTLIYSVLLAGNPWFLMTEN